jgi:hypothetical protein
MREKRNPDGPTSTFSIPILVELSAAAMLAVLHLNPILRPARLIGPVPALRHQTFEAHAAGGAKQVGADLATLEPREDALSDLFF